MKRTWIKAAVIALVGVAALAAAVILLNNNDNAYYQQKRGTMSEGFGELKTIEWQGDTYREKPAVTTILLVGIDKTNALEEVDTNEYRKGGQADFLMLIAIDKTDKKIHRLQIDRDTMTDIRIVGAFGTDAGTRVSQICLSHSYGATPEENAENTMWAVQNLMGDLEIDGYYMIDYGAMPTLNDALGGVPVRMQYDMTSVNPAWTKGKTVVLHGKESLFVAPGLFYLHDDHGAVVVRRKDRDVILSPVLDDVQKLELRLHAVLVLQFDRFDLLVEIHEFIVSLHVRFPPLRCSPGPPRQPSPFRSPRDLRCR